MKEFKKVTILGDGAWGTTLAIHLAKKKYPVTLWGPFPEYLRVVQKSRVNFKYLPDIIIPGQVQFETDIVQTVEENDIIVLAIPSQFLSGILQKLKRFNLKDKTILSVVKGIDTKTLLTVSQTVKKELGKVNFAVLSGPTIAVEVAKEIPTTAVIACPNLQLAQELQKIFNSKTFRIYTNADILGVEFGGSLKNVIAIACGVCDGLGYGTNAKSAILARGLAEMARLGVKLGAKKNTFYGLTGLGDLVTTATSPKSRNRHVGEELGKGRRISSILSSMTAVAEGVENAKSVHQLSLKHKIPMPISLEVYNILFKGKSHRQAVESLMSRTIKSE